MQQIVKFLSGLQADYDSLEVKDENTLYFTIDTHRIYRGSLLFASGLIENLMQNEDIELYGGSATDVMQRR